MLGNLNFNNLNKEQKRCDKCEKLFTQYETLICFDSEIYCENCFDEIRDLKLKIFKKLETDFNILKEAINKSDYADEIWLAYRLAKNNY